MATRNPSPQQRTTGGGLVYDPSTGKWSWSKPELVFDPRRLMKTIGGYAFDYLTGQWYHVKSEPVKPQYGSDAFRGESLRKVEYEPTDPVTMIEALTSTEQPPPPAKRSRYGTPGTTAPTLGASPGKGGPRAAGLVTGSRNSLDVSISPDSPGALVAGITLKPRR